MVFDKVEDVVEDESEKVEVETEEEIVFEAKEEVVIESVPEPVFEEKSKSLNDKLTRGINIGLNDRIAFEKKLFGGSSDDFNRVLSQLNTFDSFDEAQGFINDFVKPDYNNWDGKEEFELTDEGSIDKYLGVMIRDIDENSFEMSQPFLIQ